MTRRRARASFSRPGLWLLGCLVLGVSACRARAERERDAALARLALAIDAVRDAPNGEKAPPLARLRKLACRYPSECELQELCVQGYSLHVRSIEHTAQVRRALKQEPTAAGDTLLLLLAQSEAEQQRAHALITRCGERQSQLLTQK